MTNSNALGYVFFLFFLFGQKEGNPLEMKMLIQTKDPLKQDPKRTKKTNKTNNKGNIETNQVQQRLYQTIAQI